MTRELARPIAVAIVKRGDEILVFPVPDSVKKVVGWRPPGGTIEFGERGSDTVARELREELGVDVVDPVHLGTVENIFTYLGAVGHELVRMYAVRFADAHQYDKDRFDCLESDGGGFTCVWKRVAEFRSGVPLYPDGLVDLIT